MEELMAKGQIFWLNGAKKHAKPHELIHHMRFTCVLRGVSIVHFLQFNDQSSISHYEKT
jgi:hypothetical protein